MDLGLTDKVFIVTASSKGLGRAAARQLALEGAQVAICARGPEIDATAAAIRAESGREVFAQQADVSDPAQAEAFISAAAAHFGGLDGAVFNAGGPPPGVFLDFKPDDWKRAVDLVLMSTVHMAYAVVPHVLARGGGSLLTIQSYSVKHSVENLTLSNAIRMAVVGMMKSMANELGPQGIRVNSILPGITYTDRIEALMKARAAKSGQTPEEELAKTAAAIPLRRTGTVDEFGRTVAFLMSPLVGYIHGVALPFDGGSTASPL